MADAEKALDEINRLLAENLDLQGRVSELEGERDQVNDERPYWLWRAALERLEKEDCDQVGGFTCCDSGDCITEWCAVCAAEKFLEEIRGRSKPDAKAGEGLTDA